MKGQQAKKVYLVQGDHQVRQDPAGKRALLDHRDAQGSKGNWDLRVSRVFLALRGPQEMLEIEETQEKWDLLVHMGYLGDLDNLVSVDILEILARMVQKVAQEGLVDEENVVILVLLARQAQRDQLVTMTL